MRPQRVATLLVLLLLAACGSADSGGSSPTTTAMSSLSGSLRVSGGIAGVDDTWVLEADGTVLGPRGATGRITLDGLARLEAAVAAADFFALDAEYLPGDQCCDRFTYVLTLADGLRTNSVTTIDAAAAPAALFALIDVFREVVQSVG